MASTETIEAELETHRKELTGYCYRMLGSGFEAEDAVQETMVRAWRNIDGFEGRSALRSWLYRIAHNVCLDMVQGPQRRARPMDLSPAGRADGALGAPLPETAWITPIADSSVLPDGDPADVAAARDSIRLAFVAALQHLPPKQRAVLILCEVLRWQATEVAALLETTVASVNSALQRARATLDALDLEESRITPGSEQQELLQRYVDAFERYDIESLVTLVHDDAVFCMPPLPLWIRGPEEIASFMLGHGIGCKGSRAVIGPMANGAVSFGQYKPAGPDRWEPWSFTVLETSDGGVTGIHHFLDTSNFAKFGLPLLLEG
jgi:RNA polymerase sigma-70 factor (ECF subfamily)